MWTWLASNSESLASAEIKGMRHPAQLGHRLKCSLHSAVCQSGFHGPQLMLMPARQSPYTSTLDPHLSTLPLSTVKYSYYGALHTLGVCRGWRTALWVLGIGLCSPLLYRTCLTGWLACELTVSCKA